MGDDFEEEDELDTSDSFDFPDLVAHAYLSWVTLMASLGPVNELLDALADLARVLPDYIETTADDELIERIHSLRLAQGKMLIGLKVAEHANGELRDTFKQLDEGMQALQAMHAQAAVTGYGHA